MNVRGKPYKQKPRSTPREKTAMTAKINRPHAKVIPTTDFTDFTDLFKKCNCSVWSSRGGGFPPKQSFGQGAAAGQNLP
jgi:hypothetical protein